MDHHIKKIEATLRAMPRWPAGHTVPPDAAPEEIAGMASNWGLDHLREAAEALEDLILRGFEPQLWANIVGVNSGAGQVEALTALLGAGATKVLLVDRLTHGPLVAGRLFAEAGLGAPTYIRLDEVCTMPRLHGPTLVVASHAQNVCWMDPAAQRELEKQNSGVCTLIASRTDPNAPVAFLSLEPGGARNRSMKLAEAWLGAREFVGSETVRPVNRSRLEGCPKIAELLTLSAEFSVVSPTWLESRLTPTTYTTTHGTKTVEFKPAAVQPVDRVLSGVGKRRTLDPVEAEQAEDQFREFCELVRDAEAMERLELFGDTCTDLDWLGGQW